MNVSTDLTTRTSTGTNAPALETETITPGVYDITGSSTIDGNLNSVQYMIYANVTLIDCLLSSGEQSHFSELFFYKVRGKKRPYSFYAVW